DLYDAVWASVLKLFGEYGASQTDLALVEYVSEKRQAILRCSHKALDLVKASLAAITEIKNGKATVHIILVSGTLKALRRKI
ncbi:MAG: Rpp14/Pop5 family protein, partial [Candidatus Bathyarchaeota archaeon]|nr:Rpp14/Pop5 family protein [Candidatus Bathyarchaeota archaeon]